MGVGAKVLPGWFILWTHPHDGESYIRVSNVHHTVAEVIETLSTMRSRRWGFAGLVSAGSLVSARMSPVEVAGLLGFEPETVRVTQLSSGEVARRAGEVSGLLSGLLPGGEKTLLVLDGGWPAPGREWGPVPAGFGNWSELGYEWREVAPGAVEFREKGGGPVPSEHLDGRPRFDWEPMGDMGGEIEWRRLSDGTFEMRGPGGGPLPGWLLERLSREVGELGDVGGTVRLTSDVARRMVMGWGAGGGPGEGVSAPADLALRLRPGGFPVPVPAENMPPPPIEMVKTPADLAMRLGRRGAEIARRMQWAERSRALREDLAFPDPDEFFKRRDEAGLGPSPTEILEDLAPAVPDLAVEIMEGNLSAGTIRGQSAELIAVDEVLESIDPSVHACRTCGGSGGNDDPANRCRACDGRGWVAGDVSAQSAADAARSTVEARGGVPIRCSFCAGTAGFGDGLPECPHCRGTGLIVMMP